LRRETGPRKSRSFVVSRHLVVPERSEIHVEATSSIHPIRGRATAATGELEVGPDGTITAGRLEVDARSLVWGNPLLDRETRRRVDVRTHPSITGTVIDDECRADGRHRLRGVIAFHGVEREATGDVSVQEVGLGLIVVEGEQRLDVRDWGLEPPRLLFLKVDPEIRVRIRIEARTA
jgi:polyisoprenoid-binding protein YceI